MRCIWRSHLFRPVQVPSIQFKVQYWPREWPEKFSQRVHYKLDQYGNFQCLVIIESILECGLLMTLLISPTPALNSHQGQPRNKIRIKIDFEKKQEKIREMTEIKIRVFFEQVFEEIWACWDLKASSNHWSNEILRKLGKSGHPAATGTPPKISSKNRGKSRKPWKFPSFKCLCFHASC